jgi:hypothetical protein
MNNALDKNSFSNSAAVQSSFYVWMLCLLAATLLYSCGPKIYSFDADSLTVPVADSVRLHWRIRGKPTMLVHEKQIVTGDATRRILEFTLVAEKGSKLMARAFRQIEITSGGEEADTLSLSDLSLEGDSILVAKGIKSPARWAAFELVKLASASGRELRVLHQSRTAVLNAAGSFSNGLSGLPYSGLWELRSPLTEDEKKDHSKLPNLLEVKAIVQPKK